MQRTILLMFAVMFLTANIFAQFTVRVGDRVEAQRESQWVEGKVESIEDNRIKVRFGNGKYDFQIYQSPTTLIRATGSAAKEASLNQLREAFQNDAGNKYLQTVQQFATFYDPRYIPGGAPNSPAEWQKAMSNLAELDALCKSKYAGVPNDLSHYLREGIIDNRYAVWCEIAAKRHELEKPARMSLAKNQVSLTVTLDNLKFAFEHEKNRVPDETQELMFDRAKWKAAQTAKYKPRFVQFGVEMPADFFAEVEKKADELKTLIEQTAPNRSWQNPPFSDAAVESFIKVKFGGDPENRGAKILKIGLDYKTWVERKSLAYVGSDSSFRYYKVEYNSYKRGWILVKVPSQTFCQAREWIVGRGAKGMVVVSLGGSGIFMKCQ